VDLSKIWKVLFTACLIHGPSSFSKSRPYMLDRGRIGRAVAQIELTLVVAAILFSEPGLFSMENLRLFSYGDIRTATNNFAQRNKLGRGGFGTVYKV
jgi:hypothetical protein